MTSQSNSDTGLVRDTVPTRTPGSETVRRAGIVGTGLIGSSIAMALHRAGGWYVTGTDSVEENASKALAAGAIDEIGVDPSAEITFIATPVAVIAQEARIALETTSGIVTDVAGIKKVIVDSVDNPRFVGGHPMAGSEQSGVKGADPSLFDGAAWVLTPNRHTDAASYAAVRSVVASFGANVIALSPSRHDALVAVVSHVPHLAAASLMKMAVARSDEQRSLLRLAAGGFRDMTRIAAGETASYVEICAENNVAIVQALDDLMTELARVRKAVSEGNRRELEETLEGARSARTNLPIRATQSEALSELRIIVSDRPGVLAEITTLAGELGVNIYDLEIAHSVEGGQGVVVVVLDSDAVELTRTALTSLGYRSAIRSLS